MVGTAAQGRGSRARRASADPPRLDTTHVPFDGTSATADGVREWGGYPVEGRPR
jgi:hypothetical protein